jgi:hypothetical protein
MCLHGLVRVQLFYGVDELREHLHGHCVEHLGPIQLDPGHPIPTPLNHESRKFRSCSHACLAFSTHSTGNGHKRTVLVLPVATATLHEAGE